MKKVCKGKHQSDAHAKGGRKGVGDYRCYLVGILDETVHHIARMELLLAHPHAMHESCKCPQLHQVLALHSQQGTAPLACKGDADVQQPYAHEQGTSLPQGMSVLPRCGIYGHLGCPNEGKIQNYHNQSEDNIHNGFHPDATAGMPKPA